MLDKIKKYANLANKHGLPLPMAHDSVTGLPSVTLLAFYLGILLSVGSLIAYHLNDALLGPVSMTLLFFGMTFVFYKMRGLDKFKVDLDDKSFELEDTDNNNNVKEKNEQ